MKLDLQHGLRCVVFLCSITLFEVSSNDLYGLKCWDTWERNAVMFHIVSPQIYVTEDVRSACSKNYKFWGVVHTLKI